MFLDGVIDIPADQIRNPNINLDSVRAYAVFKLLEQAATAMKKSDMDGLQDILSLRLSVVALHQLFAAHHSPFYLEKVGIISKKIDLTKNNLADPFQRAEVANLLMEWFGLIARYLLPHEGMGETKEAGMRRGFYEDLLLAEYEKDQKKKFELAKGQFEEQVKAGKAPDQVVFNV